MNCNTWLNYIRSLCVESRIRSNIFKLIKEVDLKNGVFCRPGGRAGLYGIRESVIISQIYAQVDF